MGYNQSIESDILLLDIGDNDEYTWTDTFNTSSPSHSESLSPTMIATLFLGCVVLSIGCFYLYLWSRRQRKALQDSGSKI